jgi:hypothetical protein
MTEATGPMAGTMTAAQKARREHVREQWAQHQILPRLEPWWEMCRACKTQGLWSPQSQQRGYCERCHLTNLPDR